VKASEERITIRVDARSTVSCVLATPEGWQGGGALVLAHGAGNDMDTPLLRRLHGDLAASGWLTARFNFPYMEAGRKAPDRPERLEATWRAVVDEVRERRPARLVLGGKSMGGRIASHLAAQGIACDGLLFLGYPLHPARKPEKLRTEHLAAITCPLLFIEGTRDPLCDLNLLRPLLAELPARTDLHVIEGGDHSFNLPKRMERSEEDVLGEIVAVTRGWLASLEDAGEQ
jgi:predicted alpha/beta-hydrolase family hydrolase